MKEKNKEDKSKGLLEPCTFTSILFSLSWTGPAYIDFIGLSVEKLGKATGGGCFEEEIIISTKLNTSLKKWEK